MKFCEQGDCEYDDRGDICCKCCDLKDECMYACGHDDDDDDECIYEIVGDYDDRGGMCCKCCDLKDECEYACWRYDDDDECIYEIDGD